MIQKKNIWFLSLFSLILVLSIYYITMPTEMMISSPKKENEEPVMNVEESNILVAMRVESDEEMQDEITSLKEVISDSNSSLEEKNEAFDKIKTLNSTRSTEEMIEKQIKEKHELDSYIKIKGNNINITIKADKHDKELANKIMRTVQENFDTSKNISIKFQK